MTISESIQKIAEWWKYLTHRPVSYDREGIKPSRHWKIILITTFCVLCWTASIAMYLYVAIGEGVFFTVPPTNSDTSITLNNTLLKEAMKDIRARQDVAQSLAGVSTTIPDPSL